MIECDSVGFSEYYNPVRSGADLALLFAGRERCAPGKVCLGTRSHFLIHYIIRGAETIAATEGSPAPRKTLGPGNLFLYTPGAPLDYRSDPKDPWEYTWVGFTGVRAREILQECWSGATEATGQFSTSPSWETLALFERIIATLRERRPGFRLVADGLLLQLLGTLLPLDECGREAMTSSPGYWAEEIRRFIDANYEKPISVGTVARSIGLDRSYASRLFRRHAGETIQRYLIRRRLERACTLLEEGSLSVTEVAHSVGYEQYPGFERRFRREIGVPPSLYGRSITPPPTPPGRSRRYRGSPCPPGGQRR